jgi:hypothetical protein
MRSLRPQAESLETRQLLSIAISSKLNYAQPSGVARGTDPDGAQWTLRLYGPGSLTVLGTGGQVFSKSTQNVTQSIQTINVGGAITTQTRLVGIVKPPATGDGRVYFENLNVAPTGELGKIDVGQVSNFRTVQNGIYAIDIPDFYLAHTATTAPVLDAALGIHSPIHTTAATAGSIIIPQGVITLRFGGVDVDYVPTGGTALNTTGQNNEFAIALGLPIVQGTSIIVNSINSDAEANSTAGSPAFQDYATFLVAGRVNLFQANHIDGNTNTNLLPTQLVNTSTTTPNPGGTMLVSAPSLLTGGTAGPTGQIGNVRIGGNATNFTTLVTENALNVEAAEGQLDAKLSNYYVGGQTDHLLLIAPSGARNIGFGLGMDDVTINTNAISSLRANRDALSSNVTVSRSIGNVLIGGDVSNTNVNVGQSQSLFSDVGIQIPMTFGAFFGTPPPIITNHEMNPITGNIEPFAQNGGTMQVRIAGNVTNSVFSASVDAHAPALVSSQVSGGTSGDFSVLNNAMFGAGNGNVYMPRGVINEKVEGTIDNSNNPIVSVPNKAFFASVIHRSHGPVIPPAVPYNPLRSPTVYHIGQGSLKGLFAVDHLPNKDAATSSSGKTKKS